MEYLQQHFIIRLLGFQVQTFVRFRQVRLLCHVAAGMVYAPLHKYALLGRARIPPNLLKVQHIEDVFGELSKPGIKAGFRAYPAKL